MTSVTEASTNKTRKRKMTKIRLHTANQFITVSCPVPVILKYPYSQKQYGNSCSADEDHNRFAYPGVSFSRTKPLADWERKTPSMLDSKTSQQKEQEKGQDATDHGSVCQCSCKKKRSESFYDLFLASSVWESPEYEEYARNRNLRRKQQTNLPKPRHDEKQDQEDEEDMEIDRDYLVGTFYSESDLAKSKEEQSIYYLCEEEMQETLRQYLADATNACTNINVDNQPNKKSLDSGLSISGSPSLDKYCVLNAVKELEYSEDYSFFASPKVDHEGAAHGNLENVGDIHL